MATSQVSSYSLSAGLEVYQKIWSPSSPPKAHLIFHHGFSDRIDHYDPFFTSITNSFPIRIVAWDRRGWGKSFHNSKDRGNTGPMEQQISEMNEYINHVINTIPDLRTTPLFVMGHSMGGQETIYYMLNSQDITDDARPHISGFILEGPYIGLDPSTQPSSLKVALGRLACKLLPHFQLSNPVPVEFVSRDKDVQKKYAEDTLCHGIGTLECFRDMLERSAQLSALAENPSSPPSTLKVKLPCPVLWTHGTADKACAFPISKQLCEGLTACDVHADSKVFKAYEGAYHQVHSEPDGLKEQYAKDIGDWLLRIAERSAEH